MPSRMHASKKKTNDIKDRIVRMEARLETLEKVLQGRDPETQKILVSLAESSRSLSASFATHTEDDEKNFALIYSTNASIAKTMEEMSESMKNISRLIDGIEKKLPKIQEKRERKTNFSENEENNM